MHRSTRWASISFTALALACGSAGGSDPASTGTGTGESVGTAADAGSTTTSAATDSDSPDSTADSGDTGGQAACSEPPACDPRPGTGPAKVELRVYDIDDIVVAEVNGLRRGFWSVPALGSPDSGRIDITEWFSRGHSELRILGANSGGPASLGVQVWVDDAIVLDTTCAAEACPVGVEAPLGYFFDEVIEIDSDAFACPRKLCVHGEDEDGWLYVDGTFTAVQTPAELLLPPTGYDIAIASGTDDPPPDAGPGFVHEGRLRQRAVAAGDATVDVALGAADLVSENRYDFLVVPIRNVQYTNGQTGVLADDVPTVIGDAVELASDQMVGPFSYGMVELAADVHPTLETTVTANADGFVSIDVDALVDAGLDATMVDDHDVIVWVYSSHLADGTPVTQPPCCAWGGGGQIWMHTGWVYEPPILYYVLIHEWLHTTEDELVLVGYSGADGVHGADEHGYASGSNGEDDFAQFYRHFIRGQVPEQGTYVGAVNQLWQRAKMAAPGPAIHVIARE